MLTRSQPLTGGPASERGNLLNSRPSRVEMVTDVPSRGGLFNRHGCGHEQWAWDMRTVPALIDVFAKIWGTEELLVSIGAHESILPHQDTPSSLWLQTLSTSHYPSRRRKLVNEPNLGRMSIKHPTVASSTASRDSSTLYVSPRRRVCFCISLAR